MVNKWAGYVRLVAGRMSGRNKMQHNTTALLEILIPPFLNPLRFNPVVSLSPLFPNSASKGLVD